MAKSDSESMLPCQAFTNGASSNIELLRPHVRKLSAKWNPGCTRSVTALARLVTMSRSVEPQNTGKKKFCSVEASGGVRIGRFILGLDSFCRVIHAFRPAITFEE